ncbi:MAG: hypothetical protein GQ580_00145 [Candidatus Thorarchaeota archaeon]|nr:hypothetical protein [Candidatus Thorarchaeota archaeon]
MIFTPYWILALPIGIGILYAREAWKRKRTDNQQTCTSLAALWSIWTIAGLIFVISVIPPPPPPPGVPIIMPHIDNLFEIAVYYIFLPALAVWVLMMLDLIIYVLKTRHRIRAAIQSESSQVEALPSL